MTINEQIKKISLNIKEQLIKIKNHLSLLCIITKEQMFPTRGRNVGQV